MDKPAWIERILSDSTSYKSFIETIDSEEASLKASLHKSIVEDKVEEARVIAGELNAWANLRHKLKMYEREEEQYGIIQEG